MWSHSTPLPSPCTETWTRNALHCRWYKAAPDAKSQNPFLPVNFFLIAFGLNNFVFWFCQKFCINMSVFWITKFIIFFVLAGRIAEWKIFLLFLASFFIVFLVITGIFYVSLHGYRTIRYIFFPSFNLPEHIKEVFHLLSIVPVLASSS